MRHLSTFYARDPAAVSPLFADIAGQDRKKDRGKTAEKQKKSESLLDTAPFSVL